MARQTAALSHPHWDRRPADPIRYRITAGSPTGGTAARTPAPDCPPWHRAPVPPSVPRPVRRLHAAPGEAPPDG